MPGGKANRSSAASSRRPPSWTACRKSTIRSRKGSTSRGDVRRSVPQLIHALPLVDGVPFSPRRLPPAPRTARSCPFPAKRGVPRTYRPKCFRSIRPRCAVSGLSVPAAPLLERRTENAVSQGGQRGETLHCRLPPTALSGGYAGRCRRTERGSCHRFFFGDYHRRFCQCLTRGAELFGGTGHVAVPDLVALTRFVQRFYGQTQSLESTDGNTRDTPPRSVHFL